MWIALTIGFALVSAVLASVLFQRGRRTRKVAKEIEADIGERMEGWVAQEIQRRQDMTAEELMDELMGGGS